jgi:two-component system, NtrC family, response regulator AtoC
MSAKVKPCLPSRFMSFLLLQVGLWIPEHKQRLTRARFSSAGNGSEMSEKHSGVEATKTGENVNGQQLASGGEERTAQQRKSEGKVLLVLGEGTYKVFPLPEQGTVSIGRAVENDICIDDPSISRRHALLYTGETLRIRDLGGRNGTRLREARFSGPRNSDRDPTTELHERVVRAGETAELTTHDVIHLGTQMMLIQPATPDLRPMLFSNPGVEDVLTEEVAPSTKLPPKIISHEPSPAQSLVLHDPAMQRLYQMAERVADSTISILLLGETGVGKEVFAKTIHQLSGRRKGPFVGLNCAALSETLLESELFGHERGSFTGAVASKPGLLETAQGGTVFLDEAGELPMSTQVKLLRVIEERMVLRVGGVKPRPIDVRILSATNRDLEREISVGRFREDLYFRLNGISLILPPLRERVADIVPMAKNFIKLLCERSGQSPQPVLSTAALDWLQSYSWPGNIRELRNLIERALLLCGSGAIEPEHLLVEKFPSNFPPRSSGPISTHNLPPPPSQPFSESTMPPPSSEMGIEAESGDVGPNDLKNRVQEAERMCIIRALEQCGGNQTKAAKVLGISRRTLVTRLAVYNIPRPRKGVGNEEIVSK